VGAALYRLVRSGRLRTAPGGHFWQTGTKDPWIQGFSVPFFMLEVSEFPCLRFPKNTNAAYY
jgi:hypothetical protein